jgi:hypothetical protein
VSEDDVVEPDDDGAEVRRLLRGLPEVDPPEGFFDDLIRRKRNRARAVVVLGFVAASLGGAIVVAQATGITGDVAPSIGDLTDRHDSMMTIGTTSTREGRADVPAPFQVPDHLGPMAAGMAVQHPDDVVQVVYGQDGHYISVFEQAGDLEADAMDAGLRRLDVPGVAAWQTDDGSVVVRRNDVVYVLVGDIDTDLLPEVVEDLPDARPLGLLRRIGDAMDDLVTAFGLG